MRDVYLMPLILILLQHRIKPGYFKGAYPIFKLEMASNNNTYTCNFTWIIHSPFNPAQAMKAKFYQETPTVKEWQVTLHFEERRIGEWDILLSLIFDNRRDERPDIVVNRLVTRIILNEKPIAEEDLPRYEFKEENRHRYHLETSALLFAQKKSHQIVVEIEISLEEDAIKELYLQKQMDRNREGNSFRNDLRCLSKDLLKLVVSPRFYNVDLYSSNGEVFRVHSYILSVRWSNLFQRHSFGTTAHTIVRTNISSRLLKDILIYMYSAFMLQMILNVKNLQYRVELFKVIDWYGIHHLYKVFVKSDSFQLRESRKPEITKNYDFRLHFTSDGPVRDASINLSPQEYSETLDFQHLENELLLQIKVCHRNRVGPWLSYSLQSRANCWFYVQVNLEIIKMGWTGNFNPQREVVSSIPAHAINYNIRPNAYIESGPVLFLGCLETFGDFPSMALSGKIEQWFRFNISFNDGTSLDQLQSFNKSVQDNLTRQNVLSNHMYQLYSKEIHADMRLLSHSIYKDTVVAIRCVHKAILAARVPRMHGLLADFERGNMLPAAAKVQLREEALPYVIDYIYTGKVINLPKHLLNLMSDFANRCELPTLKELMNVLRKNRKENI